MFDGFEHLAEGQLVQDALDGERLFILGRADGGNEGRAGFLHADLSLEDVAGAFQRFVAGGQARQFDGGDPIAKLVGENARDGFAERVEPGEIRFGFRFGSDHFDRLPGRGGFLRREGRAGKGQRPAIAHAARRRMVWPGFTLAGSRTS